MGLPPLSTILYGSSFLSCCTVVSPYLRPIRRLTSNTVFSGLIAAWFLAASPIRRSSSSYSLASCTMRSISSCERRPLSLVMVIFSALPVPLSSAETWRMPLASISKVTSICGTPRGAGGRFESSNLPSWWQSLVIERSPSNLDQNSGLVVLGGREGLGLLGGNHSVAADQLREHATDSLDTQRQGSHVEQEKVRRLLATLTRQDAALHSRTVRNGLIRVDALVGLLAVEVVLQKLLHLGDTGRSTNEHKLVDLVLLQRGIIENLLDRAKGLLEEVHAQLLELGTGDGLRQVGAVEEALDLNALLVGVGERALGTLDLAAKLCERLLVLRSILAGLLLEKLEHIVQNATIEVLTTQVSVAVGGDHLKHTVVDGQERHIERATTKVKNKDILLAALVVKAIGNSGSRGLVDDAEHVQAGDGASVLRSLALSVVEVRGHSHNGILDLLAKESLCDLLHLCEHHGRHLLGRVRLFLLLVQHLDVGLAATVDNLVRQPH